MLYNREKLVIFCATVYYSDSYKNSHVSTDNLYAIKLSIPLVQYKLGYKISKFYICGSSEWNLLDVILLVPRVLRWLFFCNTSNRRLSSYVSMFTKTEICFCLQFQM